MYSVKEDRESLNRYIAKRANHVSPSMELFWWLIAIVLMAAGLIGTVLPIFPGTTIILAAAVIHRVMLGPAKSIGWRSIGVLVLLTLISYALDFVSGYYGAKYFGATKWGM